MNFPLKAALGCCLLSVGCGPRCAHLGWLRSRALWMREHCRLSLEGCGSMWEARGFFPAMLGYSWVCRGGAAWQGSRLAELSFLTRSSLAPTLENPNHTGSGKSNDGPGCPNDCVPRAKPGIGWADWDIPVGILCVLRMHHYIACGEHPCRGQAAWATCLPASPPPSSTC